MRGTVRKLSVPRRLVADLMHASKQVPFVSLRRTFTSGWGFDLNYTLSHAIDNGSGSEGGATNGSTGITNLQNAFAPNEGLGPADFDARHQITADAVVNLPVGKGKYLLGNAPAWVVPV